MAFPASVSLGTILPPPPLSALSALSLSLSLTEIPCTPPSRPVPTPYSAYNQPLVNDSRLENLLSTALDDQGMNVAAHLHSVANELLKSYDGKVGFTTDCDLIEHCTLPPAQFKAVNFDLDRIRAGLVLNYKGAFDLTRARDEVETLWNKSHASLKTPEGRCLMRNGNLHANRVRVVQERYQERREKECDSV